MHTEALSTRCTSARMLSNDLALDVDHLSADDGQRRDGLRIAGTREIRPLLALSLAPARIDLRPAEALDNLRFRHADLCKAPRRRLRVVGLLLLDAPLRGRSGSCFRRRRRLRFRRSGNN